MIVARQSRCAIAQRLQVNPLSNGGSMKTKMRGAAMGLLFPLLASAGPLRIIDLSAVATNGAVSLSWTAPMPSLGNTLTSLDVRYDTNPITTLNWSSRQSIPWLTNPGIPGSIQMPTVTGLATNTLYYFAVKTQDSSGSWSTMSTLATVLTGDSTCSVGLSWVSSPDPSVVGYKIYYGTASGVYTTSVGVGNVTSYTLSGLAFGTVYYFAATSVNGSGQESAFSNEASYHQP